MKVQNQLKKILKAGILFLGVFLLFQNCQTDELVITQKKEISKIIKKDMTNSSQGLNNVTTKSSNNCELWGMFEVTTYDDGSQDWDLMYTFYVCDQEQDDEEDQGGGGSGSGDSHVNDDDEVPPSCKSFNYSQLTSNSQASAVQNISFKIRYLDRSGTLHKVDVLFTQPIYFTTPRFSETNGGNLTNGRGATLSAEALQTASDRAKAYYIATGASESQVRSKLWEYIKDEMRNGSVKGGSASFTPPYGFNGTISEYKTTWFFDDDCE